MNHASVPLSYNLLKEITNDFSEEHKIGSGSYGRVYKGVYKDGNTIAVKMLNEKLELDDEQFKTEFNNLKSLQHDNIVRLVGYCHETKQECVEYEGRMVVADRIHRALCFEYAHNGSLHENLFDEYNGHNWRTRYRIIKGICNGLKYLHHELRHPMYHLDLKPGNVLLDKNMLPKIADFGLSRLFGSKELTKITISEIGTRGYIPPEFIERHLISNKFDIYSLGVIMIKVMAGPEGYIKCAEMSSQEFVKLVHENWRNRLQAASTDMLESYCEQIKKCIAIALTCVEVDRHKRPTIADIVTELNETETISQFPNASRNTLGSSMDQERRQTHITKEKGKGEREGLNNTENLFGAVVDNYKLDKMARYMGKPKMQEDRAQEALILVNEDDKERKASKYVHDIVPLFKRLLVLLRTHCLVYNATGDTLYQVANHDWCGHIDIAPSPTEIGNGQWAAFYHLGSSRSSGGSMAAVVYRGKNKDGGDQDYLLAWRVRLGFIFRNKSYCEIGAVDNFQKRWPSLEKKLSDSDYSSNAKSNGYKIHAKIDTGSTPEFTAIISRV